MGPIDLSMPPARMDRSASYGPLDRGPAPGATGLLDIGPIKPPVTGVPNLREATDEVTRCENCTAWSGDSDNGEETEQGKCLKYKTPCRAHQVCDAFEPSAEVQSMEDPGTDPDDMGMAGDVGDNW